MRMKYWAVPVLLAVAATAAPAIAADAASQTSKPAVKPKTSTVAPMRQVAVPEFEEAYVQAVLAHGAVTAGDWVAAEGHLAALRAHASTLSEAAVSEQVRGSIDRLAPMAARLEAALRNRDQIRANEAAFNLVTNFFPAMDNLATAGGGGGQATPQLAKPPLDAMRTMYFQAAKLQTALSRGSMDEARAQLGLARVALGDLERAKLAPGWGQQVQVIRARFEDVAAQINTPTRAYERSKDLVFALASTMHMVVSGAGGGGGMPAAPTLQDAPRLDQAQTEQERRERMEQERLERWDQESGSKPMDWRPNLRGGARQ